MDGDRPGDVFAAPALPFVASGVRDAYTSGELADLGRRLMERGLREAAVCACFHLISIAHLPFRLYGLRRRVPEPTPAAVLPWLFVIGRGLPTARVAAVLGDDLDRLLELGVLFRVDEDALGDGLEGHEDYEGHEGHDARSRRDSHASRDNVWASVALVPLGESLMACERLDAPICPELVVFPDESAFHVVSALPRRRVRRWLDVGTGCAPAPLTARALAESIVGTDINARALALAALGVGLSGATHIDLIEADLFTGLAARVGDALFDRITFNAPIPAERTARSDDARMTSMNHGANAPLYYRSPVGAGLLDRFWADARAFLADGGEVIVHSWQPIDDYPACLGLPGRVAVARYTPGREDTAFGVTVWRPDEPDLTTIAERTLSADHPFVTRAWNLD